MKFTSPGQHRSFEEFRAHLRAIDPSLDADADVDPAGPLAEPYEVFGKTASNRFAVQPMEGWDAERDGRPSQLTLRRWHRFGSSGAKLVWGGEAVAVREDGRANPNQLYLNPKLGCESAWTQLREEILKGHREQGLGTDDLVIGLQLTHSGRFARPHGDLEPRIAFQHAVLDLKYPEAAQVEPLTDAELDGIGEDFVAAASLAWNTGYDFVDLKSCHGYLLHELLAAHTRPGDHGGSLANRTRLLRRIIAEIQSRCPGLGIGVRVSIHDSYPFFRNPDTLRGDPRDWQRHLPYRLAFGVSSERPLEPDFDEPLELIALLEGLGVGAINISLGSPYYCPHLLRPAAFPPSDGYLPPQDPLEGVAAHLRAVRRVKAAFPDMVLVGSGYSYLQEQVAAVAQHEVRAGHVDAVGLGRMMLTYPELPLHVLRGEPLHRKQICRTFSDCTTGPRNGMMSGCFPLDPYYRELPERAAIREIKKHDVLFRRPPDH